MVGSQSIILTLGGAQEDRPMTLKNIRTEYNKLLERNLAGYQNQCSAASDISLLGRY